jgi:hypothetical protein
MANELMIGSVGISVILTILLRMIYSSFKVSKKWQPWIATGIGVALAIVVLFANEQVLTLSIISQYIVQGFMVGATAVGLHEMTKHTK